MPQEDKNKISDDIRINVKRSGLAEFIIPVKPVNGIDKN
jgi:hypothetical protein